jgi:hypothetical protein
MAERPADRPVEHPLACDAWQPALAGWVVAKLDPSEEAALLAHLEGCATCQAEAASLLDVAAVALGADLAPPTHTGTAPPPDLADRILGRVARERRARLVGRAATAMAAAAGAVIAIVLVVALQDEDDEPRLRGEQVVFARVEAGVEASAVVAPDGAGSLVHLTATGLDPDVTYALWLTPPGGGYRERVAAGTFRPSDDGEVDVRLRSALPAEAMGRVWATTDDGEIALDTEPA